MDEQSVKSLTKYEPRKRPLTAMSAMTRNRKSLGSQNPPMNMKAYLPEEYFKRSGYSLINPNAVNEAKSILNP